MTDSITLVSLNVERRRHLDTVEEFLKARMPDIVCFQELAEEDVGHFTKLLGASSLYAPMTKETERDGDVVTHGLALLSRLPINHSSITYYVGKKETLPTSREENSGTYNNANRPLIVANVGTGSRECTIATTHFTWSPDGKVTDEQKKDMQRLLELLASETELVLSGDFNAPRGGEMFAALASRYKDNIPEEYTTSLDQALHRAAPIEKMVDGLFTTSHYKVDNVELVSGVSDHQAISASISRSI